MALTDTDPVAAVLASMTAGASVRLLDEARFTALALALYEHQRAHVPAYDAWCSYELGTRADADAPLTDWRAIPALPIAAYKQLPVAAPTAPVAARWLSSGTTADTRSQHALQDTAHYDASLDAGVTAALVPDVAAGTRAPLACVQLQPDAAAAPNSSLTHMFDRIRRGPWCTDAGAFVDADYAIDAPGAWSQLSALANARTPTLVLATSFALAMLFENADEQGWPALELAPGSRIVDTGGYKGRTRAHTREELLDRIQHWLGVPAAWCENEYGMSELSSQAWLGTVAASAGLPLKPPAAGARWTPPWLRVRVVDPVTLRDVADGEQGLLVFHDLANVWSCAAVRSEDIGMRRGDGFELVGRAPGATLKGCSLQLEQLA